MSSSRGNADWAEDEATTGCEEVCSALWTFLEVSNVRNGRLIAWSDSCAGQNKNSVTICFCQLLVKLNRFSCIDHKFPEPGHTYLDSDRHFAHVELEMKKRSNIYSVDEYVHIMSTSVKKSKNVITMMISRFYQMKELPRMLGLKTQQNPTYCNDPVFYRISLVAWNCDKLCMHATRARRQAGSLASFHSDV